MHLFIFFGLIFGDIIFVDYSCSVPKIVYNVNILESVDNRKAETRKFDASIRNELDINIRIAKRESVSNLRPLIALKYSFSLKIGYLKIPNDLHRNSNFRLDL